jgi:transcriptional regulator with XRE-family HTH domain
MLRNNARMTTVNTQQSDAHPLRAWRARNNITLRQLAAMIHAATGRAMSFTNLSRVENGKQCPSSELVRGIYSATNGDVTASDLFGTRPPDR